MRSHEQVAVEVPAGRPQVEYFEPGDQWVPRGDVLRCLVHGSTGEPDEPFTIDDRDFAPIEFAPDDELHEEPSIEVREPEPRRR